MGVFEIEPFNFVTENDNVKNKDEYKNDLDDLYKKFHPSASAYNNSDTSKEAEN